MHCWLEKDRQEVVSLLFLSDSKPQEKKPIDDGAVALAKEIIELAVSVGREDKAFRKYLQGKYTDCSSLLEVIVKYEAEIRAELVQSPIENPPEDLPF